MTKILTSQNKIAELLSKNDLVAAPLAGITSPPFRKILRKYFDGIIYTEMVSVEGIKRRMDKTLAYLDISDTDRPVGVQLFGSIPESFSEAVKIMEDYTHPEIVDINMGCPVKKVLKSGSGSALLKDTSLIRQIIAATRKATEKPLSIKIRPGWDSNSLVFKEILKIAEGEGVDAVTMHGRVKTDMFGGTVRYDLIEELAKEANIPIIGNGDVRDKETYEKMMATGCTGAMVGRGMMKQPWVFQAIKKGVNPDCCLSPAELADLIYEISDAEKEYRGTLHFLDIVKRFAVWFSKGFDDASFFRTEVYSTANEKELFSLVEKFFRRDGLYYKC